MPGETADIRTTAHHRLIRIRAVYDELPINERVIIDEASARLEQMPGVGRTTALEVLAALGQVMGRVERT